MHATELTERYSEKKNSPDYILHVIGILTKEFHTHNIFRFLMFASTNKSAI